MGMTLLDHEIDDATHRRDAQQTGNFEVRFTDVKAWVLALNADVELDAIEDNIVWFAITTGAASLNQVEGKPVAGGHREVPYFGSRYVEANYIARGQMQKLSVYCGIVWQTEPPNERAEALRAQQVRETAEALQEAARGVSVALGRHKHLEVRSGGAMHLHNPAEPWLAHPAQTIEGPPSETCGVCGVELHFSNERWRDDSSRYEVQKDVAGRYGTHKALDHVHMPAGDPLDDFSDPAWNGHPQAMGSSR